MPLIYMKARVGGRGGAGGLGERGRGSAAAERSPTPFPPSSPPLLSPRQSVFEANYSRKLASMKHRLVVLPPRTPAAAARAGPRPPPAAALPPTPPGAGNNPDASPGAPPPPNPGPPGPRVARARRRPRGALLGVGV
jgi:hypothetical protein